MVSGGYIRRNQRMLNLVQIVLDSLTIVCTLPIIYSLYLGDLSDIGRHYIVLMLLSATIFYINAMTSRLYHSWRGDQLLHHWGRVIQNWLLTVIILAVIGWAFKATDHFSRVVIGIWIASTPVMLGIIRLFVRSILGHFRSQGRNIKRIAVIGNGNAAQSFIHEVQTNNWMGYVIKGHYANDDDDNLTGKLDQFITDMNNTRFDEVFIALAMSEENTIAELAQQLSEYSVPVHIIPDLFTFNLLNARMSRIGNVPAISIFDSPHDDLSAAAKRAEDVILSSIILLLISPLMLVIAGAVKLTSAGPVFFKQRRYGIGGQEITVWKFRSMTVCEDGDNVPQAQKGDTRITPIGAFLRKTSLDELPQFINVLQGQMSIVGPRPHAVVHNELYKKDIQGYMLRHLVKPGITGWAQINGWRGETDTLEKMEKRVEHDLEYIRNWSILFDLKIIFLTIFKGFINKNAY